MAVKLPDSFYVNGSYLDANLTVTTFQDLIDKVSSNGFFLGMEVKMPEAFYSTNEVPYPIDFWSTPNGEDIKWEIKNLPTIESLDDLELFKTFISDFKTELGYYPLTDGYEILVEGEKYIFNVNEEGFIFNQTTIDAESIVDEAVKRITSGASEAFDTLKEIEDWINSNSGTTVVGPQGAQGPQGAKGDQGEAGTSVTILGTFETEEELPLEGNKNGDGYIINGDLYVWSGSEWKNVGKIQGPQGEKGALDEEAIIALKEEIYNSANTYTDNELVELKEKSHSHSNKEILDNITEEDINKWNNGKSYSSGVGISISEDNKINVLIETGDTENTNYIKVNENNELSVETIGLDDAVTTKEITVNGGSWAEEVKEIYGDKIPVNTSWQDFLEAMLCKEDFISNITVSSSFTVTTKHDSSISGANNDSIVEVGTKVTLNKITASGTTARQSLTAKTFTYGYKLGQNGDFVNLTAYTENLLPIKVNEGDNKELKVVFTKFTSSLEDGTTIATKTGNGTIESVDMYVLEGTNKVTIMQSGNTYNSNTVPTGGTIYIATNLKNYYKSDKVTPNTFEVTFPEKTLTATATTVYTVTGNHKYFIGDITDYTVNYWETDRSSIVQSLSTSGWATDTTITKEHTFKEGTKQQTVVVPESYKVVTGKDVNNGDVTFNFIKTIAYKNAQGFISNYNVFVAPALDGLGVDSKLNITIKKN